MFTFVFKKKNQIKYLKCCYVKMLNFPHQCDFVVPSIGWRDVPTTVAICLGEAVPPPQ